MNPIKLIAGYLKSVLGIFGYGASTVVQPKTGGALVVRQAGGTAGTDEVQISHDGTDGRLYAMSGEFIVTAGSATWRFVSNGTLAGATFSTHDSRAALLDTYGVLLASTRAVSWSSADNYYTTADAGVKRAAASVLQVTNGSSGYGALIVGAPTAGTDALTIVGAASQTANLTSWKNSSGTIVLSVQPSGLIGANSGLSYTSYNDGVQILRPTNAAFVPLLLRGADGQTANLLECKNDAGTLMTAVKNDGRISFAVDVWHVSTTDAASRFYFQNNNTTFYGSPNGHTFRNSAGNDALAITNGGNVSLGGLFANEIGLTVKGAASQTANLQEWQNSSGTALSWIDSAGGFSVNNLFSVSTGSGLTAIGGGLLDWNGQYYYLTTTGVVVASGKQHLFSSTTSVFGTVDTGLARAAAGVLQATNGSSGLGALIVGAPTAATVGLTVKGAASQTANLQEWQNSSGTALSSINSAGVANFLSGNLAVGLSSTWSIASNYSFQLASTAKLEFSSGFAQGTTDAALVRAAAGVLQVTDGSSGLGALIVGAPTAATVGLTVKDAASQTANSVDVQNSSGTSIAAITAGATTFRLGAASSGADFKVTRNSSTSCAVSYADLSIMTVGVNGTLPCFDFTSYPWTNTLVQATVAAAAQKGLVIKGASSQTANLFEVQNSSGTALLYVDNNGQLNHTAQYLYFAALRGINNRIVVSDASSFVNLASNVKLQWDSTTGWSTADTALVRAAEKVIGLTNASTAGATLASKPLSPSQITSNQNNYSPAVAMTYRLDLDANRTITGLVAGVAGEFRRFINVSAYELTLAHQSSSSTAANRFLCATGADIVVYPDEWVEMVYDDVTARWRVA